MGDTWKKFHNDIQHKGLFVHQERRASQHKVTHFSFLLLFDYSWRDHTKKLLQLAADTVAVVHHQKLLCFNWKYYDRSITYRESIN